VFNGGDSDLALPSVVSDLNSAEGAAFNSRGREAVDRARNEIEARRAGISFPFAHDLVPHLRRSINCVLTIHGLTAVAI
jgi:hypothetical protein